MSLRPLACARARLNQENKEIKTQNCQGIRASGKKYVLGPEWKLRLVTMNCFSLIIGLFMLLSILLSGCAQSSSQKQPVNETITNNSTLPVAQNSDDLARMNSCENIGNLEMRDACFDNIARQYTLEQACEKISDFQMNADCLQYLSISLGSSLCSKISNQSYAAGCYRNNADSLDENSLCETIIDSYQKQLCYSDFIHEYYNKSDYSICEKFTDANLLDNCNSVFVKCDKVMSQTIKDQCVLSGARALSDCDAASSTYMKEKCYSGIAEYTNSSSICLTKISNSSVEDECLFNVAMGTRNASICSKISNSDQKDQCFAQIATN